MKNLYQNIKICNKKNFVFFDLDVFISIKILNQEECVVKGGIRYY